MRKTLWTVIAAQALTVSAMLLWMCHLSNKTEMQESVITFLVNQQSNHWNLANEVLDVQHESEMKDIEIDYKLRLIADYLGTKSGSN